MKIHEAIQVLKRMNPLDEVELVFPKDPEHSFLVDHVKDSVPKHITSTFLNRRFGEH